jgi:hypothetical protein
MFVVLHHREGKNTLKLRIATTVGILAALTAPATAFSASIRVDKSCYGAGDTVRFSGGGFSPGANLAVSVNGQQLVEGPADAAGNFSGTAHAPLVASSRAKEIFSVADTAQPALAASTQTTFARTFARISPLKSRPGRLSKVRGSGFTLGGRTLYGHAIRGHVVRNFKVGKLTGPCGDLKTTKKKLFNSGAKTGSYKLYFSTDKHYNANTLQQPGYIFTIFRTLVPR